MLNSAVYTRYKIPGYYVIQLYWMKWHIFYTMHTHGWITYWWILIMIHIKRIMYAQRQFPRCDVCQSRTHTRTHINVQVQFVITSRTYTDWHKALLWGYFMLNRGTLSDKQEAANNAVNQNIVYTTEEG